LFLSFIKYSKNGMKYLFHSASSHSTSLYSARFHSIISINPNRVLVSSTLQILMHVFFGHFNIVCGGLCNLLFCVVNMNVINLIAYSFFLVFNNFEFILHQCILKIWMNEYHLFILNKGPLQTREVAIKVCAWIVLTSNQIWVLPKISSWRELIYHMS
jgi:hypothetical protein